MKKENIILCFCKHPEPGVVKTRLAKDIGNNHAAEIYKLLLDQTLSNICSLEFEIFLYCHPDTNHPSLAEYKEKFNLTLKTQCGDDLGLKMYHAIQEHLEENTNIVLIGSDCLELNADYVAKAFEELNTGCEIVLGPAIDGGYALIGASKIDKSIFENIDWSTNQVLNQTEEKINNLKWNYTCLDKVRDLDTLGDFQYLSTHKDYQHFFKRLHELMR